MPSFTPINAPRPIASTSQRSAANENVAEITKSSKPRRSGPKNAITPKDPDKEFADTALHGNGIRKAASKGKKRARQPSVEPKTKRRKSSNIALALPVAKFGASSKRTPDNDSSIDSAGQDFSPTEIEAAFAISKAKPSACRHKGGSNTVNAADGDAVNQTRPVPVYAQQTSMDAMSTIQAQTTMRTIQQATTGGSAIYNKMTSHASVDANVRDLRSCPDTASKKPPATTNTIILRPRNGKSIGKDLPSTQLQTSPDSDLAFQSKYLQSDGRVITGRSGQKAGSVRHTLRTRSDEEFAVLDDEDESELIDLTASIETTVQFRKSPLPRDRKQNLRDVHEREDYGGALFSASEKAILERLKAVKPNRQPVVRIPFPNLVLDRSPLFGVSNTATLRTCFRVGEALNTGCQAVRTNKNVVLELYARVTASNREPKPGRKQHFVIRDMYHDNPPYLNGTFELWNQSTLWELDSGSFLSATDEGVLCRMIARMKRDGRKWRLEIMSIWQADWDDVEYVATIYTKQPVDDDE